MMNSHQFHGIPPGLHITAFNGPNPMAGSSQQQQQQQQQQLPLSISPPCTLKCPECHQTFNEVVTLYSHAAHTHYWNILASLFMSDFLLVKGKCAVCQRGSLLKSGKIIFCMTM
jgi:hypothetical protein